MAIKTTGFAVRQGHVSHIHLSQETAPPQPCRRVGKAVFVPRGISIRPQAGVSNSSGGEGRQKERHLFVATDEGSFGCVAVNFFRSIGQEVPSRNVSKMATHGSPRSAMKTIAEAEV